METQALQREIASAGAALGEARTRHGQIEDALARLSLAVNGIENLSDLVIGESRPQDALVNTAAAEGTLNGVLTDTPRIIDDQVERISMLRDRLESQLF